MKLLFVADPLEGFNIKKDSTFVMMKEAARRGHALFACEARDLMWERGARVATHVREIALTGGKAPWFIEKEAEGERVRVALADFDAVLMRTDPPVRQRVLLRHPSARAGRARRRPRLQPADGAAQPSGEAGDPRVPAVHRADPGHPRPGGAEAIPRRARAT
jgi:hypothetical protein